MLVCCLIQRAGQIPSGKQRSIGCLERHFAVREHSGPRHVDFIADMRLRVVGIGEHVASLRSSIPAILRIGEVQVGVPELDMVPHSWTRLKID